MTGPEHGNRDPRSIVAGFNDSIVNGLGVSQADIQEQVRIIELIHDVADPTNEAAKRDAAQLMLEEKLADRFVMARVCLAYAETLPKGCAERALLEFLGKDLEENEQALRHNLQFLRTLPESDVLKSAIARNESALEPIRLSGAPTFKHMLQKLRAINS